MEKCVLFLIPYLYHKEPLAINLTVNREQKSELERIAESTQNIFSNLSYEMQLSGCDMNGVKNVMFYVNDSYEQCQFSSGKIRFPERGQSGDRKIFMDCFGFVEITIVLQYEDRDEVCLHSDYLGVLVQKGELNNSVKKMAEYVYQRQEELLFNGERRSKDFSDFKESSFKSIDEQLILAEEIATVYESSYGYFKANCRFKVEKKNVIDRLEKLQYITPQTLQYVAQHPEYLKEVNCASGIRIGYRVCSPERTLTIQNIYSSDIYENRIVVGFLKTMVDSINFLISNIKSLITKIPINDMAGGDYVYSSVFILGATRRILNDSLSRLERLLYKFETLYGMYCKIMNVSDINVKNSLKPSAIFLSVPQYNKIYIRIIQWFHYGIYNLDKEKFMLSFIKISSLYEVYVLTKLIDFFKSAGFSLLEGKKCVYPVSYKWKYKNTICKNTFVFQNEEIKITLYYQPVIFDSDKRNANGVGLYRNNTISINNDEDEERRGHYYVPDFLIKIEKSGDAKYIVCDAKFSSLSTIERCYVSSLAYKYLFSISPVEQTDFLSGLCIIYGQCSKDSSMKTIYNKQLSNKLILPFAETIPLIEEVNAETHFDNITNLINIVM